MSESELLEKLDSILEKQQCLESMLKVLMRERISNKQERLMSEIEKVGRMSTHDVMRFLNISRPHAITLMRSVGKQMGYTFRIGDKIKQCPSLVWFDKNELLEFQFKKIDGELVKHKEIRLYDLMSVLGMSLERVKQITAQYLSKNKGKVSFDENHNLLKKI